MSDDWKVWNGGAMPVNCDEVLYKVRHSPDVVLGPTPPELLRWDHGRTPESAADPTMRHSDIIAYKVVPYRLRVARSEADAVGGR